jgi:sec-independent protein translocase protein TatB
MFEIGFMELVLVGVVALIVVGPERLPGLARTVGAWVGRARAFVSNVKADIDRELKAEELKRILEQQAKLANPLQSIVDETRDSLGQIKKNVTAANSSLESSSKKND